MTKDTETDPFEGMSEAERRAALDVFGRLLMGARDLAIGQWDQILEGKRRYGPWERIIRKFPDLDDHTREMIKEALPHMVDTFIYCLLADLDATRDVQVSVVSSRLLLFVSPVKLVIAPSTSSFTATFLIGTLPVLVTT